MKKRFAKKLPEYKKTMLPENIMHTIKETDLRQGTAIL